MPLTLLNVCVAAAPWTRRPCGAAVPPSAVLGMSGTEPRQPDTRKVTPSASHLPIIFAAGS